MSTRSWPYDPRVKELLVRFLRVARRIKKPYGVGGALAMAAHGYVRQTSDADAFVLRGDVNAWLRAAREEGFEIDSVGMGQYMLFLKKHRDPLARVDILVALDEPELSAVETSKGKTLGGVRAKFVSPEFLAAMKMASERPEDHHDVVAMLDRGIFRAQTVLWLLGRVWPEKARQFKELYLAWKDSRSPRRDPSRARSKRVKRIPLRRFR